MKKAQALAATEKEHRRPSPVLQLRGAPKLVHRYLEEGPHPLQLISPSPVCSSCLALMASA